MLLVKSRNSLNGVVRNRRDLIFVDHVTRVTPLLRYQHTPSHHQSELLHCTCTCTLKLLITLFFILLQLIVLFYCLHFCYCLYFCIFVVVYRFALKSIAAVLEDWPSVKAVLTCDCNPPTGGLDNKSSVGGAGEWPFTLSMLEQQKILESQQSTKHLDVLAYTMLAKTSHQVLYMYSRLFCEVQILRIA